MVSGDHSRERQVCIFGGLQEGKGANPLVFLRSYGRQEMCYFHTVRGKVLMQQGGEREMNGCVT